jgi:hypothetical protein
MQAKLLHLLPHLHKFLQILQLFHKIAHDLLIIDAFMLYFVTTTAVFNTQINGAWCFSMQLIDLQLVYVCVCL